MCPQTVDHAVRLGLTFLVLQQLFKNDPFSVSAKSPPFFLQGHASGPDNQIWISFVFGTEQYTGTSPSQGASLLRTKNHLWQFRVDALNSLLAPQ